MPEKKILLAFNSLKGSLSAAQANACVGKVLQEISEQIEIHSISMADGGEGSLDSLVMHTHAKTVYCTAADALHRTIETSYLYNEQQQTAYIESAKSIGITLLTAKEINPLEANSFGLGLVLLHAINKGAKHIYLFLGGTATSDAGLGMLSALGFRFLGEKGEEIKKLNTLNLLNIRTILKPHTIHFPQIKLIADVKNPFYGPHGAAYVYAPQKGARDSDLPLLDSLLKHTADISVKQALPDPQHITGAGAAGGIAGTLAAWLHAEIISGAHFFEILHELDQHIAQSHLVISGEGRFDSQSLQGKFTGRLAELCKKHGKPLLLFCGKNTLPTQVWREAGISYLVTLSENENDLESAMQEAYSRLYEAAKTTLTELLTH